MYSPEFDARKAQAPSQKNFHSCRSEWREFVSVVRALRRERRDRLEESACRKRCAAIGSGRFAISGEYSELGFLRMDERALDAYAPHPTDGLAPRVFTPGMEKRERDTWARIDAVEHSEWSSMADYRHAHTEACNAYLRAVDAMDKAASGVRRLGFSGLQKPALQSLKLRRRRAA